MAAYFPLITMHRPLNDDRPSLVVGTDDFLLAAISCNFC